LTDRPDHDRADCGIDAVIYQAGLAMVGRSSITKGCDAHPLSGKEPC
jgi:hypothetical protein